MPGSAQAGWTGTAANLIQLFGHLKAEDVLADNAKKFVYSKEKEAAHR